MKSIRPCTVRILSIVHFLFLIIGVSPTALSRTSTRKQKLQICTLSFLLVSIEPTYYAALYTQSTIHHQSQYILVSFYHAHMYNNIYIDTILYLLPILIVNDHPCKTTHSVYNRNKQKMQNICVWI